MPLLKTGRCVWQAAEVLYENFHFVTQNILKAQDLIKLMFKNRIRNFNVFLHVVNVVFLEPMMTKNSV